MLTFDDTLGFKRPCFISSTHGKTRSFKVVTRITCQQKGCSASCACIVQTTIRYR